VGVGSRAIIFSPCVQKETVLRRYDALADGVFNQFTAAVQIQFTHNVFAVTGDRKTTTTQMLLHRTTKRYLCGFLFSPSLRPPSWD
jgi:UDP-N-acetylmuramoylalanine-D-glutamate ligase